MKKPPLMEKKNKKDELNSPRRAKANKHDIWWRSHRSWQSSADSRSRATMTIQFSGLFVGEEKANTCQTVYWARLSRWLGRGGEGWDGQKCTVAKSELRVSETDGLSWPLSWPLDWFWADSSCFQTSEHQIIILFVQWLYILIYSGVHSDMKMF